MLTNRRFWSMNVIELTAPRCRSYSCTISPDRVSHCNKKLRLQLPSVNEVAGRFSVESACHFVCSHEGRHATTTHDAIGQSEVTWDNPPTPHKNVQTCSLADPPRPVQTCSLCSQTSVSKQVFGIRLKCLPCFIRHGRKKKGKVYKSLNHLY